MKRLHRATKFDISRTVGLALTLVVVGAAAGLGACGASSSPQAEVTIRPPTAVAAAKAVAPVANDVTPNTSLSQLPPAELLQVATTTLDPSQAAARIAAKQAFIAAHDGTTLPNTNPITTGVQTPTQQPPGNDATLFFANSLYVGVNGNDSEDVWAGYAGTNDPSEGAVQVVLLNALSGGLLESSGTDIPSSGPLHIVSSSSYGNLQLADSSGDNFTLDTTNATSPVVTATNTGQIVSSHTVSSK